MGVRQPKGPAQFLDQEDIGLREWGREIGLVLCPHYTLKRIEMTKGARGGFQYHHLKDEAGVIIEGELLVRYDPGDGTIARRICYPGDVFRFPPGAVHQGEALTDVVYIETSTPHLNDRVHVEKDYGLPCEEGGLPSTKLEDVETIGMASAAGKGRRAKSRHNTR